MAPSRSSGTVDPAGHALTHREEKSRGNAYGVLAHVVWGLFPLYFHALDPAGAWEVLAHRVMWTLVVCAAVLLLAGGVLTAMPMLLFGAAARRIPLSRIGLLQFVTPVLQLLCGVLLLGENMPPSRWIGFGIVWIALTVLSADTVQLGLARRAPPVPTATRRGEQ